MIQHADRIEDFLAWITWYGLSNPTMAASHQKGWESRSCLIIKLSVSGVPVWCWRSRVLLKSPWKSTQAARRSWVMIAAKEWNSSCSNRLDTLACKREGKQAKVSSYIFLPASLSEGAAHIYSCLSTVTSQIKKIRHRSGSSVSFFISSGSSGVDNQDQPSPPSNRGAHTLSEHGYLNVCVCCFSVHDSQKKKKK